MEKITLEMIDKFIEETGFDFDEARAYLLAAEGDLELAIEAALAKDGAYSRSSLDSLVQQVKELVRKGNLIRLIIKKKDEIVLNIPLGVGLFGVVFATAFSAAVLGVALLSGHDIILEKSDGDKINVKEFMDQSIKKAKESGSDLEEVLKKGLKESKDFAKDLKENIEEKVHGFREDVEEGFEDLKEDAEDFVEDLKEEADEIVEGLKVEGQEKLEEAKEVVEDVKEEGQEKLEEVKEAVEEIKEEIEN